MGSTVRAAADACHVLSSDVRPRMAKAEIRKADQAETWRADIGQTVARSMALLGWSLKEFAAAVQRDERTCARWMSGAERPQLDAIFAVPALRQVFVIAISEIAGADVEVETTIRVRRSA